MYPYDLLKEFEKIQNKEEFISFWNQYMRYGWKTQTGKLYRGIKKFDKNEYVVSSNQECIKNGYYTCIEMTHIFASQFQKQGKNIQKFCLVSPDERNLHCFATMKMDHNYYTYRRCYSGYKLYSDNNLDNLIYEHQIFEFMCSHELNSSDGIQLFEYSEIEPGCQYQDVLNTIHKNGVKQK